MLFVTLPMGYFLLHISFFFFALNTFLFTTKYCIPYFADNSRSLEFSTKDALKIDYLLWLSWVRNIHPLKKGKATHSSILAWRIPRTVQFMGLQRIRHD